MGAPAGRKGLCEPPSGGEESGRKTQTKRGGDKKGQSTFVYKTIRRDEPFHSLLMQKKRERGLVYTRGEWKRLNSPLLKRTKGEPEFLFEKGKKGRK